MRVLYEVENINLMLILQLRGQCYDSAGNMIIGSGVAIQLVSEEKHAIYRNLALVILFS